MVKKQCVILLMLIIFAIMFLNNTKRNVFLIFQGAISSFFNSSI